MILFFRDINIKSSYCKRIQCELNEKWLPIFPELNFIILKGESFVKVACHLVL